MSNTSVVEKWVDEAAALTRPTKVTWADGSKQEYDKLVESMLRDSTLLDRILVSDDSRATLIAAGMIFVIGLLPGLPALPFCGPAWCPPTASARSRTAMRIRRVWHHPHRPAPPRRRHRARQAHYPIPTLRDLLV